MIGFDAPAHTVKYLVSVQFQGEDGTHVLSLIKVRPLDNQN